MVIFNGVWVTKLCFNLFCRSLTTRETIYGNSLRQDSQARDREHWRVAKCPKRVAEFEKKSTNKPNDVVQVYLSFLLMAAEPILLVN